MTREEKQKAIDALKVSVPVMSVTREECNDYIQTLNKIMDWLEQEPCDIELTEPNTATSMPCGDAISFEAVKNTMFMVQRTAFISDNEFHRTMDLLMRLPSVNPTKTGHWEQYGNYWEDKFRCSECRKEQPKIINGERIIGHWSDYCPNCGARMEDEKE